MSSTSQSTLPRRPRPPKKEPSVLFTSSERKYFHLPDTQTFIKRSLRPREYRSNAQGLINVPRLGPERLRNEAAALAFVRQHTSVPVPQLKAAFEDDDAFYLVMEYVQGVGMNELREEDKAGVVAQVRAYVEELQALRGRRLGGVGGIVVPPYRVLKKVVRDEWVVEDEGAETAEGGDGGGKGAEGSGQGVGEKGGESGADEKAEGSEKMATRENVGEYVFCHNDLTQHNIVVDPDTLKVKAILDWEFAGFWPARFEGMFFERPGPSVALAGEKDDADELVQFLMSKDKSRRR